MITHHSSDALSCGLSKAVQIFVIYIYFLGLMQRFRAKISIRVTQLTRDVTSASKWCLSLFIGIQKHQEISFK